MDRDNLGVGLFILGFLWFAGIGPTIMALLFGTGVLSETLCLVCPATIFAWLLPGGVIMYLSFKLGE